MIGVFNDIIFKWKDGRTYHLDIEKDFISSYILTAGSPSRIKLLSNYLEDVEIREGSRGLIVVRGVYKDLLVTGFSSGMGPSSMAITLSEVLYTLINNTNLGFIIRMGTAGAVQEYIPKNSIVVAKSVVRDESTSNRIIFPEYPAEMDPVVYLSLLKSAYEHGYTFEKNLFIGTIQSKDDLYYYEGFQNSPLETINRERFKALERMGVLATEMEASILPILRDYFKEYYRRRFGGSIGLYVGAILLILKDELDREEMQANEDRLVKISLDALRIIDEFIKGSESLDNVLRWISSGY